MNSPTEHSNDLSEPLESQGQNSRPSGRELERDQRVDEIVAGYLDAAACGPAPDRSALIALHPDLAPELLAFFTDQDRFNRIAMPLREISQPSPNTGADRLRLQRTDRGTPAAPYSQSLAARPSASGATPIERAPDSAVTIAEDPFDESGHGLQPGSAPTISGYEILGEVGRGGMGVVYKARQLSLKRLVAVKMMRGGPGVGARELDRFEKEAEAVAHVRHPNVVQIHEVGHKDGYPYFCLEWVEGGSLHRRLTGTPLPPRVAAKVLITVARAMHYAHQCGIIHRDLKPGNILMAGAADAPIEQCVPKVTDFGLAKRLDSEIGGTRTGEIMGTPSYMSPEQASGRSKDVGPAADVYALGAILYELLTGRPPFKAATALDTVLQVLHDDPLPPSRLLKSCPRDLDTICLKCLEKAPARRYASALALAEDLERFLENKTIQARPASLRERTLKWAGRNKATAALIAFGILAVLGVLAGIAAHDLDLRNKVEEATAQAKKTTQETERLKQELERRERVAGLQKPAEANLAAARAALAPQDVRNKDLDKAELVLATFDTIAGEPELANLKKQAQRLQAQVQELRRARANYDRLMQGRDDAVIELNRTAITGLDADDHLTKTQRIATDALALFHAAGDAATPKIDDCFSAPEKQQIASACYELLLIVAETHARLGGEREGAVKALAVLDRAAQLIPGMRIHHQRRARYLAMSGDEAGAYLERARAQKPRADNALDQYLLGVELLEGGKIEAGRSSLELAVQGQPDLFWARFFLAMYQLKWRETAAAEASLTVCIFQRPEFVWSYIVRGFIRGERGEFATAEADFDKAWQLQPDRMADQSAAYVLRVNRGVMLTRQYRFEEAINELRQAIHVQPRQFQAYLNLASAYQGQMRWNEVGHQLLNLNGTQFHVWRHMEMADYRQRLLAAAKQELDRGVDLKPAAPALTLLYRERAQVHRLLGQSARALKDFEQALELDPRGRMAPIDLLDCGSIHFQEGRYDEALAACKRAFTLRPDFAPAYRLAAECSLQMRKFKDALRLLDLYLVFGRPQVEIFILRVDAWLGLGNAAAIPGEYDRALAIKPNDAALLTARGRAYLFNDAPKLALPDFQQVLAVNPLHSYAHTGQGEALVRLGRVVEGGQHAAKAIELGAREPRTWYAAARVYALAAAVLESTARPADAAVRYDVAAYSKEAVRCLSQALELCESDARRLGFWQEYIRPESERPGAVFYRLRDSDRFRTLAAHYERSQPLARPGGK